MKYSDIEDGLIKLKPIFTAKDLELAGFKVYPYQLNQWSKLGKIKRLAAGRYLFTKSSVAPEFIAQELRQPSYVSLEYALYLYNLTVDIPFHITSVTTKVTRKIVVEDVAYTYYHIKADYFTGFVVKQLADSEEVGKKFNIATPEKALVDLFYLKPKAFKNRVQFEEARFHVEELKLNIDWPGVFNIARLFNNKSLEKRLSSFKDYIYSV